MASEIIGNDKGKKKKKGGAFKTILMTLVIGLVAFWIFNSNVFKIKEKTIDALRKVPVVNNIVKDPNEVDEYANMTREELIAKIESLNSQVKKSQSTITEEQEKNTTSQEEIDRLKAVENEQLQILADKAEFDRMIATNDPASYKAFYEKVNPDTAKELYKQVVNTVQQTATQKKYLNDITAMKDKAASAVLEQLVDTDLDLVVYILKNLDKDKTGSILSTMDPVKSAVVIKRMSPA